MPFLLEVLGLEQLLTRIVSEENRNDVTAFFNARCEGSMGKCT